MKRLLSILLLPLLAMMVMWGCSEEKHDVTLDPEAPDEAPPAVTEVTCLSCHSSETELKANVAAVAMAPPGDMGPALDDG